MHFITAIELRFQLRKFTCKQNQSITTRSKPICYHYSTSLHFFTFYVVKFFRNLSSVLQGVSIACYGKGVHPIRMSITPSCPINTMQARITVSSMNDSATRISKCFPEIQMGSIWLRAIDGNYDNKNFYSLYAVYGRYEASAKNSKNHFGDELSCVEFQSAPYKTSCPKG